MGTGQRSLVSQDLERQGVSQTAAGTAPKPWIFLSYLNRLLKIQPWERSEVGQLLALKFQEVPRYGGPAPGPQQPQRCRCFPDPTRSKRLYPAPGCNSPSCPSHKAEVRYPSANEEQQRQPLPAA